MKKRFFIYFAGAVLILLVVYVYSVRNQNKTSDGEVESVVNTSTSTTTKEATVVAQGLEVPWGIAFLPDGGMLVTERSGQVVHVESGRVFPIEGVVHVGEGGLLGIALHPDFSENRYVYLYHTTETSAGITNRIVRYTYQPEELVFESVILDNMPGARYHDGGRIAFGPDRMLYVAVGDAGDEDSAQDTQTLSGTILRLNDDGSVPSDNPFGNEVYSYGHRNPQGLTWDDEGRLWSTEHGRSGIFSGFDELNYIVSGGNYGWPDSQGNTVAEGTRAPSLHSGGSTTWAPASAEYHNNGSIFFGGLRGETLYEAEVEGEEVVTLHEHFKGVYGRIRTVVLGPDGFLYITTSNRDGRGSPDENDDKIIRVHPDVL